MKKNYQVKYVQNVKEILIGEKNGHLIGSTSSTALMHVKIIEIKKLKM